MPNEIFPCAILQPYVRNFRIVEVEEQSTYKILPGTEVVIGFQFKGRLSYIENEVETKLAAAGITGLRDRYRMFRNTPGIGTVLVTFKEGGASTFFKQPIHELFRESVSLNNFMLRSELLLVEERLYEAKTDLNKIKVVEQFLISRMRHVAPDRLVATALALIHKSKGNIRIGELLNQLNISQSPLEKRFRQAVGASPKKFASIVRMKHAISIYRPENSLADLGYEAGFYDQAHFIKEFKDFTGETPESFFGRK